MDEEELKKIQKEIEELKKRLGRDELHERKLSREILIAFVLAVVAAIVIELLILLLFHIIRL